MGITDALSSRFFGSKTDNEERILSDSSDESLCDADLLRELDTFETVKKELNKPTGVYPIVNSSDFSSDDSLLLEYNLKKLSKVATSGSATATLASRLPSSPTRRTRKFAISPEKKVVGPLLAMSERMPPSPSQLSSPSRVAWSSSAEFHKTESLHTMKEKLEAQQRELEEFRTSISPKRKKIKNLLEFAEQDQDTSIIDEFKHMIKAEDVPGDNENNYDNDNVNNNDTPTPALSLPSGPKKFILSHEQNRILDIVVRDKRNVFFTGAAGTGKSVLLEKIIEELRRKYSRSSIYVTASTGLAACHIGGSTLHSFAGIGLGKEDVDTLIRKVRKNRKALKRWQEIECLVIDEISMIDGDLFDKLEQIARAVRKGRNKTKPFGGIQIVITGDFFQLPPVPEKDPYSGEQKEFKFCFEASNWPDVIEETYILKQVFRQKDNTFSTMLNEMRRGEMSQETISIFTKLDRELKNIPIGLTPTELFPLRLQVEQANNSKLKRLPGSIHTYIADDRRKDDVPEYVYNLNNLMAVERLDLKIGAQVMMIKNLDETVVNGSLGKIIGFMDERTYGLEQGDPEQEQDDVYGFPSEEEIEQDKLDIKWARKRANLSLLHSHSTSTTNTTNTAPPPATSATGKLYPQVRFNLTDGTTRDLLVTPETWKMESQEGLVMASRTQVPLILAWALSIHKAQGQTLAYVKVDLNKAFEKGQSYVAISRAVRLDGLQVSGFSEQKVMVHNKVVEFYDSLNSIEPKQAKQSTIFFRPPTKKESKINLKDYSYTPDQPIKFETNPPLPPPPSSTNQQTPSTSSTTSIY